MAATAVLLRLITVGAPPGEDEAGFLQVAAQWRPGGGSLYGHYWVDRPPLLITLFRLADLGGGLVALRLVGCVAVAATVVLTAAAAATAAGRQDGPAAARWAALVTAALLVSPLAGSQEVNGELLAAPFVAGGILAAIAASRSRTRRPTLALAAAAGACAVAALLVKQNMADVLVLGTVLVLAGARGTPRATTLRILTGAVAGALLTLGAVAAWTVAHGTSLRGVVDATYLFRLHASAVLAAGGGAYARARGERLVLLWVASGAALLSAALVAATLRPGARPGTRSPVVLALAATVAYDLVSIVLGGGYWSHYLVELVVPLGVWAGVLAARGAAGPQVAARVVVAVSVVAIAVWGLHPSHSSGQQVGEAIADVARPGDTLTTLYGEASVNLAAGLPSPYPYLWSLPVRTLDPRLTGLDAVLHGPQAPTWLVVARHVDSWGLSTARTDALVARDYHPVALIDGQTVYLHDGAVRRAPTA